MSALPRVGLVGAGRMGANHARALVRAGQARLAGVFDTHPERAAALAAEHGCAAWQDLDALVGACDAAIVAASSAAHAVVGRHLLGAGVPCLIEKPLAMHAADCEALLAAAAGRGVPLAVGHIERFNPAFRALRPAIAGWTIRALEARRFNPGSNRITDSSVVGDLMVHDIDLVLGLMGGAPRSVAAAGVVGVAGADHAAALLAFGAGPDTAFATCTASRNAAHRVRELIVTAEQGTAVVDLLARAVRIQPAGAEAATPLAVPPGDALEAEHAAFVDLLRGRPAAEIAMGEGALAALRIVWSVERQIAAAA